MEYFRSASVDGLYCSEALQRLRDEHGGSSSKNKRKIA